MALSDLDVKEQYTGDGSNTTFAIPFTPIFDDSAETKVYVGDTLQTEGAMQDYTLTGAPDDDSFHVNVEFNSPPANGSTVTVRRELTLDQSLDLIAAGSVKLATLETHLDGIVAKIQQIDEGLERAPKLKNTTELSDLSLPDPQALRLVRWDENATALENVTMATVVSEGSDSLLRDYVSHSVTDGQSATDLTGETVDGSINTSAEYFYEITRGTTVFANGKFVIQYRNSTWRLLVGNYFAEEKHGVTFSVSQSGSEAQIRAALDSGAGNGTIKLSRKLVTA